jgi:hypothetical protein
LPDRPAGQSREVDAGTGHRNRLGELDIGGREPGQLERNPARDGVRTDLEDVWRASSRWCELFPDQRLGELGEQEGIPAGGLIAGGGELSLWCTTERTGQPGTARRGRKRDQAHRAHDRIDHDPVDQSRRRAGLVRPGACHHKQRQVLQPRQ